MKKLISVLLTLMMVFGVIASSMVNTSAEDLNSTLTYTDEYGVWSYKLIEADKAVITGYDKSQENIKIPSSIGDATVVEIGSQVFYGFEKITNIIIPDTVTTIDDYAFLGCALTSITIPESVTFIGKGAFVVGENFTDIYVSENNKHFSSVDGILYNKAKTKLICHPMGRLCDKYTISNDVYEIDDYAFAYNSFSKLTIPEGVLTIGEGAFVHCQNLKTVAIPESVAYIGEFAFFDCSSLTSATISGGSYISDNMFADCIKLSDVKIGDNILEIGKCAFQNCTALTSVTIPNKVYSIDYFAFDYCTNLTSITISESVTSIGFYAFSGCSNLKDIYYIGSESQWNKISINTNNDCLTNATIHFNHLMGDVSGDGEISIIDVLQLLKHIIGSYEFTSEQIAKADINGDNKLSVIDVLMIQKIIIS